MLLERETCVLENVETPKTVEVLLSRKPLSVLDVTQLTMLLRMLTFTLECPLNYLSRTIRANLIRRALNADILCAVCLDPDAATSTRTTLRYVATRLWKSLGFSGHYVRHYVPGLKMLIAW